KTLVVFALVALVAAFAAGHHTASRFVHADWDEAELEAQAALIAAEEMNRATEREWNQKLQEARNEATKRESELKKTVADTRAAADRLRDDLARLRGELSTASLAACRGTADACVTVFGECASHYRTVAANADECLIERDALIAGWPRKETR
ncbi:MAG: DUF2514 family protein, partial [Zoogloeaceae bacterium]|nr:DUF2514 family protein [Zoogloeaceae bacterium]